MKPRRWLEKGARDHGAARACMATNLALPGFGTLMAGRWIGLVQALLTVTAFALTVIGGVRFLVWGLAHWTQLQDPLADPLENLRAIWRAARWPLLGLALFGLNWLWALASSLAILRTAQPPEETPSESDAPGTPPRLNGT